MAVSMILRNTSAQVENTFYVDGTPTQADGDVTVTVRRANGTTLSTGTATAPGGGVYRFLVSPQADLNFLSITWSGAFTGVTQTVVTHAEIVGGHIFTEAAARLYDGGALSSTSIYPDAAILEGRQRITDLLKTHTGVSWIPRFKRVVLDGEGLGSLYLPDLQISRVISLDNDGSVLTAPQLAELKLYDSGEVYWEGGFFQYGRKTLTVEYEHGFDYLKDGIDRIALMWLRNELVRSNISDRELHYTDEIGMHRLSYATWERPSGLPIVDGWIKAHDYRTLVG